MKVHKKITPLGNNTVLVTPIISTSRVDNQLSNLKSIDLVEFNQRAEIEFVRLITDYLKEAGELSPREIYAEASYELNISIETAKRYLLKHTARRAEFRMTGGKVVLK
jgi:hypothetical protein